MAKLVNSENLAQALQGVHGKAKTMVATETAAREAADTALDNRVKTLENKFTGEGDGSVASQIEAAKQEALAAARAAQTDVDNLEKLVGQIPEGASSTTIAGYVDEKVGAEQTRAEGKEGELLAAINALKGTGTGSVTEQIAAAKQELQGKIDDAQDAADAAQTAADAAQAAAEAAQAAANKAQGEVDAVETRVATLEAIDHDAYKAADAEVLAAAKKHADDAITALVNGAPEAMDTLNELAEAIEKHQGVYETYIETVTANIATAKQEAIDAAKTETTNHVSAAKTELQGTISGVSGVADAAKAQADTNKNAIATLNGDANTEGSVAAKIKKQADAQALIDQAQDVRLDAVEGKVTTLEGQMEAVEGEVSTLKGKMTTAESDIKVLEAKDAELAGQIADLEAAVGEDGSVATQIGAVQDALNNYKTEQKATDDKQDEAIAAAKTQADKGVADAAAAKTQADKGVQDAANAQAAANAAQSDATKALADAAAASTAAANALTDAKKYADDQDTVLKNQVVNTFNALNLEFNEGQVRVILDDGGELGSSPLSGWVDVPVMSDDDVTAILAGLE